LAVEPVALSDATEFLVVVMMDYAVRLFRILSRRRSENVPRSFLELSPKKSFLGFSAYLEFHLNFSANFLRSSLVSFAPSAAPDMAQQAGEKKANDRKASVPGVVIHYKRRIAVLLIHFQNAGSSHR
jgi:hypothetical protein